MLMITLLYWAESVPASGLASSLLKAAAEGGIASSSAEEEVDDDIWALAGGGWGFSCQGFSATSLQHARIV